MDPDMSWNIENQGRIQNDGMWGLSSFPITSFVDGGRCPEVKEYVSSLKVGIGKEIGFPLTQQKGNESFCNFDFNPVKPCWSLTHK